MILSMLGAATGAFVQDTPAVTRTFGEFLEAGGELMIPIGICSVLVLALTMERLLALRRSRVWSESVDRALLAVGEGRFADARAAVEESRCFAARVLGAGLRRVRYPIAEVESAMEDQAHKEFERMRRNIRPVTLIGAIAPLLGLLGTVLGISEAFHQVSRTGMGKPEVLAGGIEVALTTTIAGLAVAIPAMVIASWLQHRARRLVAFVDERLAPSIESIGARPASATEETHAA